MYFNWGSSWLSDMRPAAAAAAWSPWIKAAFSLVLQAAPGTQHLKKQLGWSGQNASIYLYRWWGERRPQPEVAPGPQRASAHSTCKGWLSYCMGNLSHITSSLQKYLELSYDCDNTLSLTVCPEQHRCSAAGREAQPHAAQGRENNQYCGKYFLYAVINS